MSSPFHIVSDFDGVWTEPVREYEAVFSYVVQELDRLTGRGVEAVDDILRRRAASILSEPDRYGWRIGGLMTSYVDEDFFALPAAVGVSLEEGNDPEIVAMREGALREFPSMGEFMDHCFHTTCERFRLENEPDLTRGADKVLNWLHGNEVRVTFVTNAPAVKVREWFGHHGIEVADATDPEAGDAPLRVYGRAGKQWLGESKRTLEYAGRDLHVDRPRYREILEREQADMVIGDVLSLDLALGISMRLEGHGAAPRHVVLLYRRETPEWVKEGVGEGPHRIDELIAHITALPRLVNGWRARTPVTSG